MLKTIGFSKAKAGLSLAEFRDHYERVHAPLALKLLPMIRGYTRNYVQHDDAQVPEGLAAADFPWICITEMWFDDAAAYAAFREALTDPAIRQRIAAAEARFVAPNSIWKLIVDEVPSEFAGRQA